MTASKRPLPLPVRLMNRLGAGASSIGLQPVKLSVESLLEKAATNTGLSDFGADDFRLPLALLLDALEKEANLSLLGRLVARGDLLRTLENRLRMVDLFSRHPEIAEQPIERLEAVLANDAFTVTIDLHLGEGTDTVYTCDCSEAYVRINSEYTT